MNTEAPSRRRFVIGGLVAAGLAGCDGAGSGLVKVAAEKKAPPLTQGEVGRWETLLGQTFTITGESGKAVATLTAIKRGVSDAGRPPELGRDLPFYVFFEMDARMAPVGDKTYQVSHSSTGAFDLFVGLSTEQNGKAVFNALLN
ncbi:DUF6916 family protein [Sphingomonas sp. LT1P40]|uniref:DUF6916 family protein n=1 Tax=Alteristakelama amylovorans TaxID=3096166 RepID=UPI002FCA217F